MRLAANHQWGSPGLNFRSLLFGVFINYLDVGIKYILRKFASYTKIGGTVNFIRGRENLQKDMDKLERWQSPTA